MFDKKRTKHKLMPNMSLAMASSGATLFFLGVFFIWAKPNRSATYYVPRYSLHSDRHMQYGCADCHQPYQKITKDACYNCHEDYSPGANLKKFVIYPEGWTPQWKEDLSEREKRVAQAHRRYHAMPGVAEQNCSVCHVEHRPIAETFEYSHSVDSFLNAGANMYKCMNCHGVEQAPPDAAHALYLAESEKKADCWKCHFNTESWELRVSPTIEEK